MANVSTTKMSSKGQVVIPDNIRRNLNLKAGAQFIVVGDKDVVILKSITPPSIDEFDELIAKARNDGKKAGLKKTDITEAIKKVRGKK
jgi:AbrB family looped-hinge helix DNA binding protein